MTDQHPSIIAGPKGPELWPTLVLAGKLFVPGAVFLGGVLFLFAYLENLYTLNELKDREQAILVLQVNTIRNELERVAQDLNFLVQQNELRTLQSEGGTGRSPGLRSMEQEYLALSRSKGIYSRLCFLDTAGRERIRVNSDRTESRIVPPDQLQDKSDRSYFKESLALGTREIFLSPLNLEEEDNRVLTPIRPRIIFGIAAFDHQGRKQGVILASYKAKFLLDRIQAEGDRSPGRQVMLNSDGYKLDGPVPEENWGFMYPDRQDDTLARLKPAAWQRLLTLKEGQNTSEGSLYTFITVHPLELLTHTYLPGGNENTLTAKGKGNYFWILAREIPPEVLNDLTSPLRPRFLFLAGSLMVFVMFLSWILARLILRRRSYQHQLEIMAQFDALTGLPNRTLFFDRLERAQAKAERDKGYMAVLYLDLDGFKAVNDTMGHETGDELLIRVARVLKDTVRKSDTAARLGGDEFAVILSAITGPDDGLKVGEKIVDRVRNIRTLSSGAVQVGTSVGIAVYPDHTTSPDDLLRLADAAMYRSKEGGKNRCSMATRGDLPG